MQIQDAFKKQNMANRGREEREERQSNKEEEVRIGAGGRSSGAED